MRHDRPQAAGAVVLLPSCDFEVQANTQPAPNQAAADAPASGNATLKLPLMAAILQQLLRSCSCPAPPGRHTFLCSTADGLLEVLKDFGARSTCGRCP
jgi:hypothetical protein